MDYTTEDLVKAYLRAQDRGPAAAEAFKARVNAAALRVRNGERVGVAFFDLLAEDPEGKENS